MCFISNIQKNSFLTAYHTMLLIRRYTRAINSRNTPFNVASRINSRNLVFLLYSAVTRLYLAMNSKWAPIVLHIPVCTAICSTIADNPGGCALEFGACLIFAPVTPTFTRFFAIFRCVIFAPASRYINSCVTLLIREYGSQTRLRIRGTERFNGIGGACDKKSGNEVRKDTNRIWRKFKMG